jgi:lipopolysaccharide transport system ATP-binding protein/teichoic acid transport system ATP-binding protein
MENLIDPVIDVCGVGKNYKLYKKPVDRFLEALSLSGQPRHKPFHALADVSFRVMKGQTVGILGRNGAGKSTLLKILTGVLTPSTGTVEVKGRIASLLELGAGFNPEYTGSENIYFQGALMGYSAAEMKTRVPAILEFADIGEFIHQPVRVYSSGMFARLAFSVAINVDPDVLIIDEALSVGDAGFQLKCMLKMQDMQSRGTTILFVSHDTQSIIRFCQAVIIMENGRIVDYNSDVLTAAKNYEKRARNTGEPLPDSSRNMPCHATYERELGDISEVRFGSGEARINAVDFIDADGVSTNQFSPSDTVTMECYIQSEVSLSNVVVGYSLRNTKGLDVAGDNTLLAGQPLELAPGGYKLSFSFPLHISPGEYFLFIGMAHLGLERVELDQRWPLRKLSIVGSRTVVGSAYCPSTANLIQVPTL